MFLSMYGQHQFRPYWFVLATSTVRGEFGCGAYRGEHMLAAMLIREATSHDWPRMWAFMEGIVRAGETFTWDRDTTESQARRMWFPEPPGRTFVAVEADGTVLGTANSVRNHRGGAAHIAGASFMVDPTHSGRGVGRALGEHVLEQARKDGFRAMQFNAVVETNTRAVSLWTSLGFTVMTTLPAGFHHPVHGYVGLHIMYRPLT